MTMKDDVKAHLEKVNEFQGPTQIGLALGLAYASASSKVNSSLKLLVAEGWAERREKPVRYGKKPTK
jgi:hypothetical protein